MVSLKTIFPQEASHPWHKPRNILLSSLEESCCTCLQVPETLMIKTVSNWKGWDICINQLFALLCMTFRFVIICGKVLTTSGNLSFKYIQLLPLFLHLTWSFFASLNSAQRFYWYNSKKNLHANKYINTYMHHTRQ